MTFKHKSCMCCIHYIKLYDRRVGLCLLSCKVEREPYITRPGLAICDITLPEVFCDEWQECVDVVGT